MKGIYLTEQGKQEIEAKIAEIEYYEGLGSGMADVLKEILSSATILPVEESWMVIEEKLDSNVYRPSFTNNLPLRINKYPQGVIIQPKQKKNWEYE